MAAGCRNCPVYNRTFYGDQEADVVIYGGTSSGVIAAIQVAKMGKSVILVGPDKHLGGLTSGGLGYTDAGNTGSIGGMSREFYEKIYQHYSKAESWQHEKLTDFAEKGYGRQSRRVENQEMWTFEPHVAERIFDAWISEYEIKVLRDEWLDRASGVVMQDGRIVKISMLSGRSFIAKVFIDATYEGDLMAAAGVSYHVGREANAVYGERWNGIQLEAFDHHKHYFHGNVSPYKVAGDPESGVLPCISTAPPGKTGDGDHRVQAYCFRTCLTRNNANRIPFLKPDNYNPATYELLLRELSLGKTDFFEKFDMIPNLKTDTNNHGAFSSDFIGMNYEYPEASYGKRREIIKAHQDYQQGLYYFAANDQRMPDDLRTEMSQWGLAADEFLDNGNWPHQIYVREARRMIGEHVMTEHNVLNKEAVEKPIGMGSYTLDSHCCQRYITKEGYVQNEGDVGVRTKGPYQISYNSVVPKKAECMNLLVPVCVSSSHIAFGSIRMEPVFMILGQSAATAAVLAIDEGCAVQDVSYSKLRERLKADKQRF
ncbi:MAG: FAD-dependent oxidoreductase [Kiritimatiellae bacterium]|nr:FAD-dependent oxidoreductase [Kiritimatiellia bacterium]